MYFNRIKKKKHMRKITKTVVVGMTALALTIGVKVPASTITVSAEEVSAKEVFSDNDVKRMKAVMNSSTIYNDYKLNHDDAPGSVSKLTKGTASRRMDVYPYRKGVILVTMDAYKDLIPTGHAAIIYDTFNVVESLAVGVTTGGNDWYRTKTTCYGVAMLHTNMAQDRKAANYCYNQIGKPYNYNYYNMTTRKKFYCSQLIYAAYLDKFGIDLNTAWFDVGSLHAIHPGELVLSPETYKIYQK